VPVSSALDLLLGLDLALGLDLILAADDSMLP
jgi:hypothetical protein